MPEGDTVWRTAHHLDRALTGQVLTETDFRVPAHATLDLSGRPVVGTVSRGKHLLTRIGDDHTLHTHLKMEGSWHLYKHGTRWRRPAHEARVVLRTESWTAVGFALGITEVVARQDEDGVVGHLGPDLLGPDWDEEEALRRLTADPRRPIGEALLDQRNLAGIGNMYKAELLFITGIHPTTPVGEVTTLPRLVRRAKQVLETNKERVAQTTTGNTRRGEQHWVYMRARRPCRRCGTRIVEAELGGREAFWCPRCQPERS
ncbi:DNA-formamidopyrimidine glycosylase family protein [Nocardioides caldifontis]|uniref:DNA-formamidopyrimidine glycosylase family protein n=1 Tax=Nocardioides caldifontis TaxID=2588938 RepID=UPI0011DF1C84|nr:DNA-formamidopyrimidine glycosylase family protein [Nocardioides caldifontis]